MHNGQQKKAQRMREWAARTRVEEGADLAVHVVHHHLLALSHELERAVLEAGVGRGRLVGLALLAGAPLREAAVRQSTAGNEAYQLKATLDAHR